MMRGLLFLRSHSKMPAGRKYDTIATINKTAYHIRGSLGCFSQMKTANATMISPNGKADIVKPPKISGILNFSHKVPAMAITVSFNR